VCTFHNPYCVEELHIPYEVRCRCWQAALERQAFQVGMGAVETSVHQSDPPEDKHYLGLLGEWAWEMVNDLPHHCFDDVVYTGRRPDGLGWEIRTRGSHRTDSGHLVELYVKDSDPDDRDVLLLIYPKHQPGAQRVICVIGSITAREARETGHPNLRLGPHTYVHQSNLDPQKWREAGMLKAPPGHAA
jgi:hypothetical protein